MGCGSPGERRGRLSKEMQGEGKCVLWSAAQSKGEVRLAAPGSQSPVTREAPGIEQFTDQRDNPMGLMG